jgi:hypothetical protein
MGKLKLYLETTVISVLTARKSRNVVVAASQTLTKKWWVKKRHDFELFVSDVVFREARAGDAAAAARRLKVIGGLPSLAVTDDAYRLFELLLQKGGLPTNAGDDALHLAIATVQQMDIVLTWNLRHLANPLLRRKLETICTAADFVMPLICTPMDILGGAK